ncbi:hypothetical protein BKA64DRAFT_711589 [Cadophora sp. MPI-SDFR-AT-0126]|nr:hypothetical protein BKA64DRAFT_711589 [Leotiomycetes sp. MPI-SDFR-AT-0126]
MSSTSSPSRSSFGEETIFAFKDLFVLPSDATAGRTSAADASHYGYSFASGKGCPIYTRAVNIGANLDLPENPTIVEEIADCLEEEYSETYSYASYRPGDKDWLLFNNSNEALPILDNDDFFQDADACVDSPAPPYKPVANVEEDDVASYDHTEHIEEALNDFEIRSQDDYIPAELSQSVHQETLLQDWQYDYQRHEWVALKFHQPPYTTESYSVPYSVPYTTEHQ